MNQNYESLQITDLCLATTISLWHSPVNVYKSKNKAVFVFPSNQETNDLINLFWENKIQVEPKQFFSQLKNLKTRIYSLSSSP